MAGKMRFLALALVVLLISCFARAADPLPIVSKVAVQPLAAHVKQLTEALDYLGNPLPEEVKTKLTIALAEAVPEKWLTMFTHDPEIPWGYVEKKEDGKMGLRKVTA